MATSKGMLVVGLDHDGELSGVGVNPRHRALSFVKVWELDALAEELEACALVVVLVPDGPFRAPTAHEVEAFVDLRRPGTSGAARAAGLHRRARRPVVVAA